MPGSFIQEFVCRTRLGSNDHLLLMQLPYGAFSHQPHSGGTAAGGYDAAGSGDGAAGGLLMAGKIIGSNVL